MSRSNRFCRSGGRSGFIRAKSAVAERRHGRRRVVSVQLKTAGVFEKIGRR